MEEKRKKRKKTTQQKRTAGQNFLLFVLNFVGMLGAVFLVGYIVLVMIDGWTQHGDAVYVPQVKGKTLQEAELMLKQDELEYEVVDSIYVKDEMPGRILEVTPEEKMPVKRGRKVYLTINTNAIPLRVVPDVAENSSQRQAEAKLLAVGFQLSPAHVIRGELEWVYGVMYKGDTLTSGAKAPIGATLTLLVGNGESKSDFLLKNDSLSASTDSLRRVKAVTREEEREAAKKRTEKEKDNSWFE